MRCASTCVSDGLGLAFFSSSTTCQGAVRLRLLHEGKARWELRVTTVWASRLTSRVSSTGLVIELRPIESPVIMKQILGDRSGPRSEWEAQPTCQDRRGQGYVQGLPPVKLIKACGLSWNGVLGGRYVPRGPCWSWSGQLRPAGTFGPWHNHPGIGVPVWLDNVRMD